LKIAYVKNGDVVDQLMRIEKSLSNEITNGPDAFIYDFLINNLSEEILLLSISDNTRKYQIDKIKARVFYNGKRKSYAIICRICAMIQMFLLLLFYKPNKIICGCTGEQLWISYFVALILDIPIVHSRHNMVPMANRSFIKKVVGVFERYIIRNISGVIVHGPFLYDQIKAFNVKSGKLYEFDVGFRNLSDKSIDYFPDNEDIFDSVHERYLLYVGRIERNKGVFDLLLAAKAAISNGLKIKLVFVGDGADFFLLRKKVKCLRLDSNVILLGKKDRESTFRIIRSAFLVVCPTKSDFPEGRCMVAMEALVMGVPVVAPDFGPFPYLISHNNNGMLYHSDSVEDLAKCISRIASDEPLYNLLCQGASETKNSLAVPIRTFNQALNLAFK
jgi:glycosyltransferase involved in cell wall biosynthesis